MVESSKSYRQGELEIGASEDEQSSVFCEPIHDRVMAYVNVAEWKTDQVCEWLKGAENRVSLRISVHCITPRETK